MIDAILYFIATVFGLVFIGGVISLLAFIYIIRELD
jgi:hypothetical protein